MIMLTTTLITGKAMTLMTWVAAAAIHLVPVRHSYLYVFKVLIEILTGLDYD